MGSQGGVVVVVRARRRPGWREIVEELSAGEEEGDGAGVLLLPRRLIDVEGVEEVEVVVLL